MVLMVNFFTNTPCNNGLHIAIQGAAELIELYSKDEQNKENSTLPKIAARWRQMEFCIFCAKPLQIERSSVVCSLNVNKLS